MTIQADQVADAFVAVPGTFQVVLDQVATADRSKNDTAWADVGPEFEDTFTIGVGGLHRVKLAINSMLQVSSTWTEIQFRLLFDEGEANEQYVGGDSTWAFMHGIQNGDSTYLSPVAEAAAELSAGSHTVKLQWRAPRNGGGTVRLQNTYGSASVDIQMISGSGAGGTIVQSSEATDVATETITNSYIWPTVRDFSGLSASITAVEGERVLIQFAGSAINDPNSSFTYPYVGIKIDGTVVHSVGHQLQSQYYLNNHSFSYVTEPLAAGNHTIQICGWKDDGGHSDWRLYETQGTYAPKLFVTQFRGGQVPWEKDGTTIATTPRAINVTGGLMNMADDGSGKLELRLPEAVTAAGDAREILAYRATVADASITSVYPTFADITDGTNVCEGDFEAETAGLHRLRMSVFVAPDGTTGSPWGMMVFQVIIDEGTGDEQILNTTWKEGASVIFPDLTVTGDYQHANWSLLTTLSAGSHTIKVQAAMTNSGDKGKFQQNFSYVTAALEAITGSGAGGTLSSRAAGASIAAIGAYYQSPWTPRLISDLTQTITVAEGEQVLVNFSSFAQSNAGGERTANVYLYIDDEGTQDAHKVHVRSTGWSDWERGNLSFSYTTEPLAAGDHTFRIYVASTSSGATDWLMGASYLHLTQFRGGLVPITDGVRTVDKPTAQEFVNAEVQDVGGKALITLPEAVTKSGRVIEAMNVEFTGTQDISTTGFTDITEGTADFSVPEAGLYLVHINTWGSLNNPAVNGSGRYQVRITGATTWTSEDNTLWSVSHKDNARERFFMTVPIEFSAGEHSIQFAWKRVDGATARFDAFVTMSVHLEQQIGSGAGGTLVDQTYTAGPVTLPTSGDISIVSESVDVSEGENVLVTFVGRGRAGSASTYATLKLYVDSVEVTDFVLSANLEVGNMRNINMSFAHMLKGLSVGSHVVELRGTCDGQAGTAEINQSYYSVTRIRGGLVPFKQDNLIVQDKPIAINAVGPGLLAENVDGQVNLSVEAATEGLETGIADLSSNWTTPATYSDYHDVDNGGGDALAVTLDVAEGESVFVMANVYCTTLDSTTGANARITVDGVGVDTSVQFDRGYVHPNPFTIPIAIPIVGLSAGSRTFKVQVRSSNAAQRIQVNGGVSTLRVSRLRGGYSVPENIPVLGTITGQTYQMVSAPGATGTFSLALNDGARYTATSPLSVDLTTTGLGGLEASAAPVQNDTFYYTYAVPGAVAGTFDVIASDQDPDSGGPADYDIFRYLGTIPHGTAAIVPVIQRGARFQRPDHIRVLNAAGNIVKTTTGIDVGDVAGAPATPPTAGEAILNVQANQGTIYVYPENRGGTTAGIFTSNTTSEAQTLFDIPVVQNPPKVSYETINNPIGVWIYSVGWVDKFLQSILGPYASSSGGGGAGTLDRHLVFSDDTEFTESGTSYVTKKTFRLVNDSDKPVTAWRLVAGLWTVGGTSAEVQLQVVGTGTDSDTATTTETSEGVVAIDLPVSAANDEDDFLTVNIQIKQTGGGVAHIKYTDLYAVYE
jgi:hypothetical protein